MNDLVTTRTAEIVTRARPKADVLINLRKDLNSSPKLQEVFKQAKTTQELAELVCEASELEVPREDLFEAALYLVEEAQQVGSDIVWVSETTGKALFRIRQEDIWQPDPLPREDGSTSLAPQKVIRPDVLGPLIQWVHDRDAEAILLSKAPERSTAKRLLTLEGRNSIAQEIKENLTTLIEDEGNPRLQQAFSFFERGETLPRSFCKETAICLPLTLHATLTTSLVDMVSLSHAWTFEKSMRTNIVGQLLRSMICQIGLLLRSDYESKSRAEGDFLFLPPEAAKRDSGNAFPVLGLSCGVLFRRSPVGFMEGPFDPTLKSYERMSKWVIEISVAYDVWVQRESILVYSLPSEDMVEKVAF